MKVRITVKLTPQSKMEMIDTYPAQYAALRAHMEKLVEQGVLPTESELHWLLDSGKWEEPKAVVE